MPDSVEGTVRVEGVPIERFWTSLRMPQMAPLKADVDLESNYRLPLRGDSLDRWWKAIQATGRVWLSRLRWDRSDVGPEVRTDFRWENEQIELRDLTGTLTVDVTWQWSNSSGQSVTCTNLDIIQIAA